jgi:hypothetical protein
MTPGGRARRPRVSDALAPLCLLAVLHVSGPLRASALETPLDRDAVERALQVARSADRPRADYHAGYVVDLDGPVVERVEVVSEFRRIVLMAEERLALGDWMFARSATEAERALEPWRGATTIAARLRFNPLNVLASVPPYLIVVGPEDAPLMPSATERTGILVNATMTGATIESRFDSAALENAPPVVRVVLDGATVATVAIDFGAIE